MTKRGDGAHARGGWREEEASPLSRASHGRIGDLAQIRSRVLELGDWFHNLDLGGVATAPDHFLGDYPAVKWRAFAASLPDDLRGKSVLDIGCNAGFYSFELERRGATVLGIDEHEGYLAQARYAAEIKGSKVQFRRLSVYHVAELGQRFDIVLCLGLLYHLRHPLLALDLIHEHVAADLMVFQSMQRGSDEIAPVDEDYDFAEIAVFDQPAFPKLHFVERKYSGDGTNWWIPNRACAAAMLRSAGFEIVQHPEREVFICRRVARPGSFEAVRPAPG